MKRLSVPALAFSVAGVFVGVFVGVVVFGAAACGDQKPAEPSAQQAGPASTVIGEKIKAKHDALSRGEDAKLGKAPPGTPSPHLPGAGGPGPGGGHGGGAVARSNIAPLPATAVVLKVDGQAFTKADIERTMSQAAALAGIPPEMLDGEMKDAFESPAYEKLIERVLLGNEARRRNVWPDDAEAKKTRDEMVKTLPKGKTLDDVLQKLGTDEATFAKDVTADIAIGKLLKALEAEMPAPSPELIDKVYLANKAVFVVPDTATASQVLVKLARDAPADVVAEAQARAREIKALVVGRDAKTFAKVASERSDDSATRARGGDLGVFKKGDLFPEIEQVAFTQKAGEIAGPVQTERGLHIVRAGGVTKGRTLPEKEAKAIIAEREKVKAFMQRVDELTAGLRKAAKIERVVEPLPSPLSDPAQQGSKVPPWKASGQNAMPGMMNPHSGEKR